MASPHARPLQASRPVPLESHAVATLRYIRQSMDAATGFAVPGSAGIAMGAIGLLVTVLSLVRGLTEHWLVLWLVAAAVAALVGGALVLRPASLQSLLRPGTPLRKFALCLLPSLLAGAVLTVVLGAYDALPAIPGTWLLLYGCGLISTSVATRPLLAAMGSGFLALGLIALLLPLPVQMLLLGTGFGGLHLLFGLRLLREAHGRES